MEMYVKMTYGEALDRCLNWDRFCEEMGLNPWLLNEGLTDSDDKLQIPMCIANKYFYINLNKDE